MPAPSGDAPRPVCELLQSWGAGGQQREGGAGASPCTLRPGSRAPGFPALRRSPRVPPHPPPARFDVGRGLPGAPGIGWQSRLSGAAAVTLRLGLRAGRKQACVEFLFDPHGGINRKRRAPSRALHLPLLWALRSTGWRRLPGTPARRAVWARLGARPVSTLLGDSRLSVR